MAAVGTVAKLAENVVGRAVHAALHPLETAGYAVGVVNGLRQVVTGHGGETERRESRREPQWVPPRPGERLAGMPDIPPPLPDMPGESFTTEPKATSRDAEHGGPEDPAELEPQPWDEDPGIETPVGTTGVGAGYNPDTAEADLQQPDTEPLLDPSLTKQVKAEAETLQKAAEPEKD